MSKNDSTRDDDLGIIALVDDLNEQVKTLALNLALYLAKAKARTGSKRLTRLEPEFIALVNGTVKVVKEVTTILDAARNAEVMAYEVPSGRLRKDQIEVKLHGILEQCNRVLSELNRARDIIA